MNQSTILEKPLVILINKDSTRLEGATKIDYNKLTQQYTFWLGESKKIIGFGGYTILEIHNNKSDNRENLDFEFVFE